ncbi:unnamed protein product [Rotaria magnacalcarata]|uniref:Uncharacterized protein n=1 Tax=Rotaria magnacalcarata TaxID=392030 RepID=A0A815XV71_9BILA|nr:unnamed protein product [Rotaria magnacalcarata]
MRRLGGKQGDSFWDFHTDLEMEAKDFSFQECSKKEATFTAGHDESTYKSGELSAKRWIAEDDAPFYNKGRGRSIMASDFLVMYNSGPCFSLNDKEF